MAGQRPGQTGEYPAPQPVRQDHQRGKGHPLTGNAGGNPHCKPCRNGPEKCSACRHEQQGKGGHPAIDLGFNEKGFDDPEHGKGKVPKPGCKDLQGGPSRGVCRCDLPADKGQCDDRQQPQFPRRLTQCRKRAKACVGGKSGPERASWRGHEGRTGHDLDQVVVAVSSGFGAVASAGSALAPASVPVSGALAGLVRGLRGARGLAGALAAGFAPDCSSALSAALGAVLRLRLGAAAGAVSGTVSAATSLAGSGETVSAPCTSAAASGAGSALASALGARGLRLRAGLAGAGTSAAGGVASAVVAASSAESGVGAGAVASGAGVSAIGAVSTLPWLTGATVSAGVASTCASIGSRKVGRKIRVRK